MSKPWPAASVTKAIRSQRLSAAGFFVAGVTFIGLYFEVLADRIKSSGAAIVPLFGVFLLFFAHNEWRRANARIHGIKIEHIVAPRAERTLTRRGFDVRRNASIPGSGDIDLVAQRHGVSVPIEIKSFRSWEPGSDRCKVALWQAWRGCEFLHAPRGFVWLPDAKVGLWRRWFGVDEGRVRVVFGSARNLARIVNWWTP